MDFGDRSDNPFSVSLRTARAPRKQALKSALRVFLIACVCLAVLLVISSQGPKWLVHRLTRDFATLTAPEKKQRLVQIADLGKSAIPCLVQTMADPSLEVGRAAYELLQQAQNDWSVLEASDRTERHAALVHSLQQIAVELPDDRTGWGTSLLQHTVMENVDRQNDEARQLYQEANHAIDLLSLSGRTRSHDLGTAPAASEEGLDDSRQPKRLAIRAQPLPVDQSRAAESWTQWPPPQETRFEQDLSGAGSQSIDPGSSAVAEPQRTAEAPTVYRSGSRLQAVDRDDQVALNPVTDPIETSYQAAASQTVDASVSAIQSVAHLVDSPLETYDDHSVVRWLGSEHAALREKAESELVRRGYGPSEISIATQIASANAQVRMELVDAIAQSANLDPRPWLLMLLDDPSRDVKLRVISALATMNDPSIGHQLQLHLAEERDPTVAARIRRVLKLR